MEPTTKLTQPTWETILADRTLIKEKELDVLIAFGKEIDGISSGSSVAKIFNYKNAGGVSLLTMHAAKRIAKEFDISFSYWRERPSYWTLFFNGWSEPPKYIWQLKPEVLAALEKLDYIPMVKSSIKFQLDEIEQYREGAKTYITTAKYDRNQKAREKCIKHYGCKCYACNFDFKETYGSLGEGFIHVHHKLQIAKIGVEYIIDPINDLIPLCPNCHFMVHKADPMLTIEQLKELLSQNQNRIS